MMSVRFLALVAGLTVLSSWTSGAPTESSTPEVTLNIQTRKLTSLVDERFLSLSVDPEQLLRHSQPGPGALRMLSMATAMSPAYLRVAGPNTELMGFEGSPAHAGNTLTVNDHQWGQLQTLCHTAGLRAIVALGTHRRPGGGCRWDSRDAMRILAAIDASSIAPAGWQLGYDWTTLRKGGVSPSQLVSDIHTLKSLIEEFPTLAKEAQILLGPDADPTTADAEAIAELAKGANIGAIVIRPFTTDDPTGAKLDKDFINKALGRNPKRPLWIAESGGACTAPFSSGLLWAQRLATATRLGAQVIFRDLDLDAARDNATPDLWVSLLHKTLTSRGVLEGRESGPEAAALSISAHCTPSNKDHEGTKTRTTSPAIRYDLGAVTVVATNPSDRSMKISLKIASGNGIGSLVGATDDGATMVHEYVLTAPNNDLNSTQTLLNGSPLEMASGGGIPVVSPRQLQLDHSMKVSLPPRSIAFWVIPGAKARACQTSPASSDVAPAASRLRPISSRGMEIGMHLDGDSPMHTEPEHIETPEEIEDTQSGESKEILTNKDLRRRRQRISNRPSGTPRLSLPRISSSPRRPSLDLNLGKSGRDEEISSLDDFIREELRSRPRHRTSESAWLPALPSLPSIPSLPAITPLHTPRSLELPSLPAVPSLYTSNLRSLGVPSIELPNLPTLGQLDTSTVLDPLGVNADLQKFNSEIQHSLVEQATTPLRSLVKITDGVLDRIQGKPKEDRAKRSTDDNFGGDDGYGVNEDPEMLDMDERMRFRRKTVLDFMKEDLSRKQKKAPSENDSKKAPSENDSKKAPSENDSKKAPSENDSKKAPSENDSKKAPSENDSKKAPSGPIPRSEILFRRRRDVPRKRRFAPEDMGLRLKRKPAVPEYLSLPRLPKKPLLTSPAAKRAQLLLSQNNEEGTANSWGSTHREMFPQGDVFAGTEKAPDARNPDIDYVSDDDYPAPEKPTAPVSRAKQPVPEGDALYYAPAEFYDTLVNQRRAPARAPQRVGEFGELEYLPGKISPGFDDAAADTFKVVPAAKPNKEHEAEIQSKLRKRLEDHYADVQKAALDRKAEPDSEEDNVPEENMDMDSLRALAERYRQEKKLDFPEDVSGSANGLQKQAEPKEIEKTNDQKSRRRRRDVGGVSILKDDEHKSGSEENESAAVVHSEPSKESKGLPIIKASDLPSDPSHRSAEDLKEKRMEKIKAFREKMTKSGKDRPHLPLKGKIGHDSSEHTALSRPKRDTPLERYSPLPDTISQKQNNKGEEAYGVPMGSTGAIQDYSEVLEPKQEELWPFARNRGSYGGMSGGNHHNRPYGSQGFGSFPYESDPYAPGYPPPPSYPHPPPPPPIHFPPYQHPHQHPYQPWYPSNFGSSHSFGSYSPRSEESDEESGESHPVYFSGHHQRSHGFYDKSSVDFDPDFDVPEDCIFEDFSLEARTKSAIEQPTPQKLPNIATVPWDISRPTNVRYKRSVDPETSNTIVQTKTTPQPSDEIAEAIRNIHKILNDDTGSSEETSVEVHHGGRLVDSAETVDSLEDTIQSLLNMTRHLNDTLNQEKEKEMISWSDFGLDDSLSDGPQLDPEEMKFRDAAVAWIQAAKKGDVGKSPKDKGVTDHHLSVKKQLPDGEESSPAVKELARQQKLTEQENIVTAMMQRVSVLLSELRTILSKKEEKPSSPSTFV